MSLFTDDMILSKVEHPDDSTKKKNLLKTIKKYSKVAGYKNLCTKIPYIPIY